MGNHVTMCAGKQKTVDDDEETKKPKEKKKEAQTTEETPNEFEWEEKLMEEKLAKSGFVTHAAIVDFNDEKLKAKFPNDFVPDARGIKDILEALNGDSSGLAERSISLGCDTPVCVPGKLDEGKTIYASDGQDGGCSVYKTKTSILIVFYDKSPDTANRLASEVAEYMEDNDR